MKKRMMVLGILLAMVWVAGCGALYGKKSQYDDGDWYLFASSSEVARIEQDKLALAKLNALPAQIAIIDNQGNIKPIVLSPNNQKVVPAGYRGKIANFEKYDKVNFIISGAETKGWLVPPGQIKEYYLPSGKYTAEVYIGSRKVDGPKSFTVNAQTHNFMGEELHWYIYYED